MWALDSTPGDGAGDVYGAVDDVAFIADLVKCIGALGVRLSGDALLAGYSLGAKFASHLACSPPAGLRVRAQALAAGVHSERPCTGPPAPLLLFQGGGDTQVPFCVRAVQLGALAYEPSAPMFADWVVRNGGAPAQRDTQCHPLSDTTVFTFPGAATSALYWLPLGTHVWPQALTGCAGGATDVALRFFADALAAPPDALLAVPPDLCAALEPCARDLPCDVVPSQPPPDRGGSWR